MEGRSGVNESDETRREGMEGLVSSSSSGIRALCCSHALYPFAMRYSLYCSARNPKDDGFSCGASSSPGAYLELQKARKSNFDVAISLATSPVLLLCVSSVLSEQRESLPRHGGVDKVGTRSLASTAFQSTPHNNHR